MITISETYGCKYIHAHSYCEDAHPNSASPGGKQVCEWGKVTHRKLLGETPRLCYHPRVNNCVNCLVGTLFNGSSVFLNYLQPLKERSGLDHVAAGTQRWTTHLFYSPEMNS